jgi:hypothetical protein
MKNPNSDLGPKLRSSTKHYSGASEFKSEEHYDGTTQNKFNLDQKQRYKEIQNKHITPLNLADIAKVKFSQLRKNGISKIVQAEEAVKLN